MVDADLKQIIREIAARVGRLGPVSGAPAVCYIQQQIHRTMDRPGFVALGSGDS
jgi:hypothetical protein